jgi:predicted acyl esterase
MRGAARGYVVVIQDTRGRYASDGEFYTFKNE